MHEDDQQDKGIGSLHIYEQNLLFYEAGLVPREKASLVRVSQYYLMFACMAPPPGTRPLTTMTELVASNGS